MNLLTLNSFNHYFLWEIILNYKLNCERVFNLNCQPVFRTRSSVCGREIFIPRTSRLEFAGLGSTLWSLCSPVFLPGP